MLELGAYLQSSNETKEEIEACEESKQFHENELESVLERLERNEARVSTKISMESCSKFV